MRTHERVLAAIEHDLAAGRWALGARLPSERALAEELGVSRPSVREAVRILEAMGIVRTAVGSGPEAGATVIDRPAAGLGAAVRLHVASGTLPVADVVGTRVLLETWAVGEAARREVAGVPGAPATSGTGATSDTVATSSTGATADTSPPSATVAARLAEAHDLLDRMDAPGLSAEEFQDLDARFHVELVALAGNGLVEAIMAGLRSAIAQYVAVGSRALPSWTSTAERLRAEHRGILDAVEAGRAEQACERVRAHILGFYDEAGL
ncbi:GntR family transcriptional repressor for pyruvate dehydrogenase complex [Sediminihabitans luteus]|uniref:GntR family transcriptional repressor for pyruvate dehydrogenase complex n=1 Tax=Sediminihabitans luteus TaxID=1138585 RepID=A0A2M9CZV5_9CELL|nr:GntR family transcriptional regulator [Sediminihabitans luteus]PJJ77439.1 GntR family transcriptional repressor for pyruvate dehydrogenase complex [Sediminihabitans luteus]GII98332.1 GntR family transcriptional regulator [Sediminihabitans luteus]